MSSPATIDYISDWSSRIRSRLYTQFRGKITWLAWCDLIAKQAQDLEDALQSILTLLDIDNSSGVQLDTIGRIVGQPRVQGDDATYRLYLKARIRANRSTGTAEDLYGLFRALYGTTIGLIVTVSNIGVRDFVIRVKGVITRTQAVAGVSFLRDAKEAGTGAVLEWQESPTSQLFVYDGTTAQGYDAGVYAGASRV